MRQECVYKNFYNKFVRLMLVISFIVVSLTGLAGGFLYFLIGLTTMMLALVVPLKSLSNTVGFYDTITVNNKSKELVFKSYDNTYEIFPYSEISEIKFCPNDINDDGRIVNYIEIYLKSGAVSQIEFAWQEFSLNFLKKLPRYITITKLQPSTKRQMYNLLLFVVLTIVIACLVMNIHSFR